MKAKELNTMVDEWLDGGLITPEQARAILAHESRETQSGLSLGAEFLAYLGATVALAASLAVVGDRWEAIPGLARVRLLGFTAAALFFLGRLLDAPPETAGGRLAGVLWALSVAAAACFVGFGFDRAMTGTDGRDAALAAGIAATPYALVLWRRRPQALQQVALFGTACVALIAGVLPLNEDSSIEVGWTGLTAGVAWFTLTKQGLMHPLRTGYALGSSGVLLGSQLIAFESEGIGLAVGLGASCLLLALGPYLKQLVVLALGAAGILLFLTQVVYEYFGETAAAPLIMCGAGIALVAAAVLPKRFRAMVDGNGAGS